MEDKTQSHVYFCIFKNMFCYDKSFRGAVLVQAEARSVLVSSCGLHCTIQVLEPFRSSLTLGGFKYSRRLDCHSDSCACPRAAKELSYYSCYSCQERNFTIWLLGWISHMSLTDFLYPHVMLSPAAAVTGGTGLYGSGQGSLVLLTNVKSSSFSRSDDFMAKQRHMAKSILGKQTNKKVCERLLFTSPLSSGLTAMCGLLCLDYQKKSVSQELCLFSSTKFLWNWKISLFHVFRAQSYEWN